MNTNPFQKIDSVLQYICEANQPPYRIDGEIYSDCNFDQNSKELFEILHKLKKDNYIVSDIEYSTIKQYYSTFEGQVFLAKGAYTQQHRDEELNRTEKLRIEKLNNRNNCILTFGTFLGSLVGLGILILELYKFFNRA
jgi:DNA-binding PadR family transcriptional regulator